MLLRRELISFPNNGAEREKPVSASAAAEEYKLAGRTWIRLIFFSENTTRFETMSFRSSVLHHWLSCPLHPAACEGCGWAWSPFLTARDRGTRARGNWNISWSWKQDVLCCHSSNAGQNCCVCLVCFSLWSFFFFYDFGFVSKSNVFFVDFQYCGRWKSSPRFMICCFLSRRKWLTRGMLCNILSWPQQSVVNQTEVCSWCFCA